MTPGTLIILNGGSSAGKTSLAKALQGLFEETYLLLGIDAFWFSLPPRQLDLDQVDPEYYSWRVDHHDGRDFFEIIPGPILDRAMLGRYRAIRVYLDLGLNVIADDVVWKRDWLIDTLKVLQDYRVFFIGVHVSDEEGARREQVRGDRHIGWNRGSARAAHREAVYDLEVDTSAATPEACAHQIKQALDGGLEPAAFATLRGRFAVELNG
jgi:chloramphenicol 3-O phosphotransferase